jgi:predicted alpha/beta hydrolase
VVVPLNGEPPELVTAAPDGVPLALYRARPADPRPAPPLLLVHGTFSNRTFFLGANERGMGRWLAQRGYDVWVAELRGHGRSGSEGRANRWHFEDWILRDAPALVRAVLEATGSDRLIWIGHSAGGVIGFALGGLGHALSGALGAIVALSAAAPTGLGILQYPMAAAGLVVTRLMGRFPARLLGIGPEDEHPGIFAQWMKWNLRGRWHGSDGTDYYANARRIAVPVLGIAGGGDWLIAPPELCRDLLGATSSGDRTFMVAGRAQGFSEDFNHHRVVASSAARAEVWPLIADWIEARFA